MAFRYYMRRPESDDVLDPRDWNLNHAELVGEFNGYLDRDNLPPEVITTEMVAADAFNRFLSDSSTVDTDLDADKTDWQHDEAIGRITAEATTDCLLIVEWSGHWLWHDGTGKVIAGSAVIPFAARIRITVDGTSVGETGWLSAIRERDATYLCGAMPVQAGKHIIRAEIQHGKIDTDDGQEQLETLPDDTFLSVKGAELIVRERRR